MGKGELEKRELDRRKQRFRTSPFMCDTPVVTYMDYLIKEKGSS